MGMRAVGRDVGVEVGWGRGRGQPCLVPPPPPACLLLLACA